MRHHRLAVALLCTTLLVSACGQTGEESTTTTTSPDEQVPATTSTETPPTTGSAAPEPLIRSDDGILSVFGETDVPITVTSVDDHITDGSLDDAETVFSYELGPDGQTFGEPLTLLFTVPSPENAGGIPAIAIAIESGGTIETLEADSVEETEDGYIVAVAVDHFSRVTFGIGRYAYAVIESEGGPVVRLGDPYRIRVFLEGDEETIDQNARNWALSLRVNGPGFEDSYDIDFSRTTEETLLFSCERAGSVTMNGFYSRFVNEHHIPRFIPGDFYKRTQPVVECVDPDSIELVAPHPPHVALISCIEVNAGANSLPVDETALEDAIRRIGGKLTKKSVECDTHGATFEADARAAHAIGADLYISTFAAGSNFRGAYCGTLGTCTEEGRSPLPVLPPNQNFVPFDTPGEVDEDLHTFANGEFDGYRQFSAYETWEMLNQALRWWVALDGRTGAHNPEVSDAYGTMTWTDLDWTADAAPFPADYQSAFVEQWKANK